MSETEYRAGDPIPGTQYRFLRVLGAGGHGEVYEVEHTFLEARAVMKLLHGHLVDRDELAARMTREARTLAKLRHPNIVEVRDGGITGETPPRPYFVMESLSGMSLRELLRQVRGGVGVQAALRIVTGVLDGLHHAHRAGVIHRDIKPDNIFLHRTSTDVTVAKVLDFGIAHLLLGRRVTGKAFVGTPRYAAPEQLRGEPPTDATDVYAAGLVLYELLAGEPPFAARRALGELVQAHFHEILPPPSKLGRDVPPVVDRLVAMFCAKAPSERPPNAFAAAVMLRELRAHVEAIEAGSMHAPEFRTEPSPMDDALYSVVPGDDGLITELPSSGELPAADTGPDASASRGRPNDTVPSAPPLFRTEPMAPPLRLEEGPVRARSDAPRLDRAAVTRTADRSELIRAPRHDTVVDVPPALADTTPEASVYVKSAPRVSGASRADLGPPRGDAVRDEGPRRNARQVGLFVAAVAMICAVGLPLAWRTSRPRPAPALGHDAPPPPALPSPPEPSASAAPIAPPAEAPVHASASAVRSDPPSTPAPARTQPSASASADARRPPASPPPRPTAARSPGYDD